MISKPYLLFLGEAKDDLAIKTAAGISFWRPEWCVGQIFFENAEAKLDLAEMSIEEAIAKGCKTMVIGVVNAGGVMPETWISTILEAINAGLNIASGMHTRLSSIREFREAAEKNNVQLHDLRFNEKTFKTGSGVKRKGKRLLTVGTDCSVGKKYTALAIEKAGSADRSKIAGALRAIGNAPGEVILPGEWSKAKKILAAGGDIHYNGGSGPQDFDANGDVAGSFSASVVVDGAWVGKILK